MNASIDTIVAVATPPGAGGVGIVRASGPQANALTRTFLGSDPHARHAHFCAFHDSAGDVLDRGLLLWFPAPHSFTGEDVLELHAHGSPVVLRMLVARCIELGARAARPGEFSERAFLNGKLDLAQAEAVADLIASGSEAAARAAQRSLEGDFSTRVRALVDGVIRLRSYIEAAIDFSEEEIDFLAAPAVLSDVEVLRAQLAELLAGARRGVRLADGLHAVIVGAPNEIAGTTRDVLRETIDLDGIALTLVDTAGLREAGDVVEAEGIRRARAELERADLAIVVTDDVQRDDTALAELAPDVARIIVHNKIDLFGEHDVVEASGRKSSPTGTAARIELRDAVPHIWLSAKTREGLELLIAELRRRAGAGESGDGAFSARARHVNALERARTHLDDAADALTVQQAGELAAEELRSVQHALDEITGQFSTDDLLGKIFGSFCIGK